MNVVGKGRSADREQNRVALATTVASAVAAAGGCVATVLLDLPGGDVGQVAPPTIATAIVAFIACRWVLLRRIAKREQASNRRIVAAKRELRDERNDRGYGATPRSSARQRGR